MAECFLLNYPALDWNKIESNIYNNSMVDIFQSVGGSSSEPMYTPYLQGYVIIYAIKYFDKLKIKSFSYRWPYGSESINGVASLFYNKSENFNFYDQGYRSPSYPNTNRGTVTIILQEPTGKAHTITK